MDKENTPVIAQDISAQKKCLECTRKHLLAALSYLIDLSVGPYQDGFSIVCDEPLALYISYELILIYYREALDHGGHFYTLLYSELARFEDYAVERDINCGSDDFATARDYARHMRRNSKASMLSDLGAELHGDLDAFEARPFLDGVRTIAKVLAHLHEACREAPITIDESMEGFRGDIHSVVGLVECLAYRGYREDYVNDAIDYVYSMLTTVYKIASLMKTAPTAEEEVTNGADNEH